MNYTSWIEALKSYRFLIVTFILILIILGVQRIFNIDYLSSAKPYDDLYNTLINKALKKEGTIKKN